MERKKTIVTSFGGESALMSDCRYIQKVYYIKNKECFFIEGKWYRINSGLIVLNHTTKKYVLKSKVEEYKLKEGVVEINGGKVIYGYFDENIYENVLLYIPDINSNKLVINDQVCKSALLKINVRLGRYVLPPTSSTGRAHLEHQEHSFIQEYKHSLSYRAENSIEEAMSIFLKDYKLKTPASGLAQYIPYSWGMEFETNNGVIPPNILHKHGLIPLRDGSIAGLEYATVPLRGEKGIQNTLDICDILSDHTTMGFDCSFHVHLGGYQRSVSSILALYTLGVSIQESVYSFFPSWYKNTSAYKRRSYVGPLNAIDKKLLQAEGKEIDVFSLIYKWYSGGQSFMSLDSTRHPSDPNGEHKWTIEQRYTWLNLIPLIFSNRGTVEFRIHPPTHNKVKVLNWLLICSAILKYAEIHQETLIINGYKKITLAQVLSDIYPKNISNYLLNYMLSRKETFQKLEASGEGSCETDIRKDYIYSYPSIFDIL